MAEAETETSNLSISQVTDLLLSGSPVVLPQEALLK